MVCPFRPIDPAGTGRSTATGASSSVRASSGGGGTTSTSMEITHLANRPLPTTPDQRVRLSSNSLSSVAEIALPAGQPIYPSYRDFSSVPQEHMKWHDVIGSKWRRWGARHPYLQGGLGLAGTSAISGVFWGCKLFQTRSSTPLRMPSWLKQTST